MPHLAAIFFASLMLCVLLCKFAQSQENFAGTPSATLSPAARSDRHQGVPPGHRTFLKQGPELTETISVGSDLKTQLPGRAILSSVRCGLRRSLILRTYEGGALSDSRSLQKPAKEVRSDGRLGAWFAVTDADPQLLGGSIFVGLDGSIYQTAWIPDTRRVFVVKFSKRGRVVSVTYMGLSFQPYGLAVYRNGNILITGLEYPASPMRSMHKPVTAIFRRNGALIRKISLPDDEKIQQRAAHHDPNYVSPEFPEEGNFAVEYGDIGLGDDGNVYLIRRTSPSIVYVISRLGRLVRTLELGWGDSNFMPAALRINRNAVAVLFHSDRDAESVLQTFNYSGTELASYKLAPNLGEAFGCYTPPSVTFLTSVDGVFHVLTASIPHDPPTAGR